MKSIRTFCLGLFLLSFISVPSYASVATTGKGMWIWQIWNDEGGNLASMISRLKSAGVTWIAVKLGDSNSPWNSPGHSFYTWASANGGIDSVVSKFHSNGIKFYGWQYVYGANQYSGTGTTANEADVTNEILDIPGIDGFIIDAEVEFEASGMTAVAAQYVDSVRAAHPNSFVALTSFARVTGQPIPWTTFLQSCDVNMPQAYWALRPTSPVTEFNAMRNDFNSWEQTWINEGYITAIKPIVPIGCEGPNTGYTEEFGDIQQFSNLVQGVGYVGMSLWEYADMDTMNWRDYADSWVVGPPTVPQVASAFPPATGTAPAYDSIRVNFNTPMDAASVIGAFSISPQVSGKLRMNPDFTAWIFIPDTLLAWSTQYTVTINTSAVTLLGVGLSSTYSLKFTTVPLDNTGPYPIAISPRSGSTSTSHVYFEFMMNKPVNYSSFVSHLTFVDSNGTKASLAKDMFQLTGNNITLAAFRSSLALTPGMKYTASISPGVTDYYGNPSSGTYSTTFVIDTAEAAGGSVIEGFESGVNSWTLAKTGHGTTGVDTVLTSFSIESSKKYDGSYAAGLQYTFDTTSTNGICEVENTQGFDISTASTFGIWIFGDNSGDELEFVFGSSQQKTVPIDTINWYGWRFIGIRRDVSDASTDIFAGFAVKSLQSALLTSGALYIDDIQVNGKVTGTKGEAVQPVAYGLFQNYPNPFNPTTTINYQISAAGNVTLKVYDVLGREVTTLVNRKQYAGGYSAAFDAGGLPSGVYFYSIAAGSYRAVKKMILIK